MNHHDVVLAVLSMLFARFSGNMLRVESFSPTAPSIYHRSRSSSSSTLLASTSPALFDYEYIPPNPNAIGDFKSDLKSAYPDEIPASLRGEAIRSALRSGRCVGWNLDDQIPLRHGLVKMSGKGTWNVLNGKLTTAIKNVGYQEACLLTSKGRVIDRLGIAVVDEQTAYLLTSPGHSAERLRNYLDKFIFPLDEASVEALVDPFIVTLVSVERAHVQKCYTEYLIPKLKTAGPTIEQQLPKSHEFRHIALDDGASLLILPSCGLSSSSAVGFTFVFMRNSNTNNNEGNLSIGKRIWDYLISDDCPLGPIQAGGLEYESLRIEGGHPAFGLEMTGYDEKKIKSLSSDKNNTATITITPAAPLELHFGNLLDLDKGCYLGQEGVASMMKNPRGPPRILYQVVFDDKMNVYDFQSRGGYVRGGDEDGNNLTRLPVVGDRLFVLGSNEEINIGHITSVAQPSSTGDPCIYCLALVRRADSVLRQMKQMDLRMPRRPKLLGEDGIIYPPPLDPLDGLEVIVGGTFTIGRLAMVPARGRRRLYVNDVPEFVQNLPGEDPQTEVFNFADRIVQEPIYEAAELEKAIAEAEAAAAEAKRKEEKLKLLQKRAEEAMARRNKRAQGTS